MKKVENNSSNNLLPEIDILRNYLQKGSGIELAILFGSMVTGCYTIESDVDVAIKKTDRLQCRKSGS